MSPLDSATARPSCGELAGVRSELDEPEAELAPRGDQYSVLGRGFFYAGSRETRENASISTPARRSSSKPPREGRS